MSFLLIYLVNEYTKQAIKLNIKEAEYLAKNSILIIAERIAKEQLEKEGKKLSNINVLLRKTKVLRQIKKDLANTNKIKKLENTNIYSVDVHAQDFEWTTKDMKKLYFNLHDEFAKTSNSKLVISKNKKLDFLSKFINKIMILYPQWETERLMNLDSYVNNPINCLDNSKNKYNFIGITKNKIAQLHKNDKTNEYKTFLIPQKYWDRKKCLKLNIISNHIKNLKYIQNQKKNTRKNQMIFFLIKKKNQKLYRRKQNVLFKFWNN